jgi:hypothetical protein
LVLLKNSEPRELPWAAPRVSGFCGKEFVLDEDEATQFICSLFDSLVNQFGYGLSASLSNHAGASKGLLSPAKATPTQNPARIHQSL